ncbi:MAG: hypothetical protein L3J53_05040 [Proteobacteria bacterium]|nr:hypothetical protein [Pseudomonadota bacterium]
MKKILLLIIISAIVLTACTGKSSQKNNLDDTLYKYASLIRWSDYDAAAKFIKLDTDKQTVNDFDLHKLKQFKVSRYVESPISPGHAENIILQSVEIHFYNIHSNQTKVINDRQSWEFNDELQQWFLISGLPKL